MHGQSISYVPGDSRQDVVDELLRRGWLKKVEWYPQTDSTNNRARVMLAAGELPRPTLLVADEQTSGRGRSTRSWWSPHGCLMFTLVVDSASFQRDPMDPTPLSLLCGVAIADAVSEVLQSQVCQLKWPNDLYLNGRKLAGILIESVRSATTESEPIWIIGIGLNVDVDWRSAPEEVSSKATCLTQFSGENHRVEDVVLVVMERLQRWLDGNKRQSLHWLSGWADRCLLTGKRVTLRTAPPSLPDQPTAFIEGNCEGVDEHGRLLIRQAGELTALSIGEVVAWSR